MIHRLFVVSTLVTSTYHGSRVTASDEDGASSSHSFLRLHRHRQLQGGLICDANSDNAGTICTDDRDCPVSSWCGGYVVYFYIILNIHDTKQ